MHTEVTNLPNLAGYLRFGRDLPVIRFADKFNDVSSICEAFIERQRPPHRFSTPPAQSSPAGGAAHAPSATVAPAKAKPAAGRKGARTETPEGTAPELPFDAQVPPVQGQPSGEQDAGAGLGDVGDSPTSPTGPFAIIAPSWTHDLRQHGRPDGSRRPAKPA
jgi:hypothetical protein